MKAIDSNSGILLVAHTSPAYVAEAVAMAWSIRRNSPGIAVALATDVTSPHLPEGLFDAVVRYDFTGKGGVIFKLWLDEISPFAGRTLFLDSDAFAYRPLCELPGWTGEQPFVALGEEIPEVGHWFRDPAAIRKRFAMEKMALLIGDHYNFDRSAEATAVFRRARELFAEYDVLGIQRLHGGFNEEPLFSLAMHHCGIAPEKRTPDRVAALDFLKQYALQRDALQGHCRLEWSGSAHYPVVVHFGTHRSMPSYFVDRCRVDRALAGRQPLAPVAARRAGTVASLRFRIVRRARRLRKLLGL